MIRVFILRFCEFPEIREIRRSPQTVGKRHSVTGLLVQPGYLFNPAVQLVTMFRVADVAPAAGLVITKLFTSGETS